MLWAERYKFTIEINSAVALKYSLYYYYFVLQQSETFQTYKNLCCRAFLILRRHADLIISLFALVSSLHQFPTISQVYIDRSWIFNTIFFCRWDLQGSPSWPVSMTLTISAQLWSWRRLIPELRDGFRTSFSSASTWSGLYSWAGLLTILSTEKAHEFLHDNITIISPIFKYSKQY